MQTLLLSKALARVSNVFSVLDDDKGHFQVFDVHNLHTSNVTPLELLEIGAELVIVATKALRK